MAFEVSIGTWKPWLINPTSPRGFCSGLWKPRWFPLRPAVKTLISEGEMRQGEDRPKWAITSQTCSCTSISKKDAIRSGQLSHRNWKCVNQQVNQHRNSTRAWTNVVRDSFAVILENLDAAEIHSNQEDGCGSGRAASRKFLCYEFVWRAGGVGWLAITS